MSSLPPLAAWIVGFPSIPPLHVLLPCSQATWNKTILIFFIFMIATLISPMIFFDQEKFCLKTKNAIKKAFLLSFFPMAFLWTDRTRPASISMNWFYSSSSSFKFTFEVDLYSLTFFVILLFVSWSILEFSLWYMKEDQKMSQFFKYLLMFLLTMILFVFSSNLYTLFIGWEGVGIMSFLLIGWYFARSKAGTAALQAVLYNRIGDIGLLFAMFWMMSHFNSTDLNTSTNITAFTLLMIAFIIGAASKSAQFGLHPWLASAMEGPTPVSALLHSSTMVVAGVFLLIRLYPIIQGNQTAMTICLCLGAISTAFAASSALTQNDIKKIIAFSTSSQLGLMMLAIGLNNPNLAFIHICAHAFFKAMLFLCSGVVIHNLAGEQDIRKMGGLQKILPFTTTCMTIGSMALMGTPFLAGFFSKDAIIEAASTSNINNWALILAMIATSFTAVYSLRIIFFSAMYYPRFNPLIYVNENNKLIINPIKRLALGSIVAGFVITQASLDPTSSLTLPNNLKMAALTASLLGFIIALNLAKYSWTNPPINNISKMMNTSFYFTTLHRLSSFTTLDFAAKISLQLIDMFWLQKMGPLGLANLQLPPILKTQELQKGLIKTYLSIFSISSFILLITWQLV